MSGATSAVKSAAADYAKGRDEVRTPEKHAPAIVGADGHNMNDPRRLDRADAVAGDGRALNDPRRLDAAPDGKLPPATSISQKVGRVVGSFKSGQDWMAGEGGKVVAGNSIKRVVASGAGFNDVERADGSVERQSGARNWRNNNPGNIEYGEFAKKRGAIGSDGRFAIFPDYQTGRKAKESLIFDGKGYKDLKLTDAIARYAPPSENDTAKYQKAVLAATGGQNKSMSEYTPAERAAVMDAMEKQEGFKVGKVKTLVPGSNPSAGDSGGSAAKTVVAGVQTSTSNRPVVIASGVAQTATAGVQPITPVSVPSPIPAKLPEAPQVQIEQPEREMGKDRPITAIVKEAVGQDVGDRNIAHIVTGGIAAS